jgi:hypothetical protein
MAATGHDWRLVAEKFAAMQQKTPYNFSQA